MGCYILEKIINSENSETHFMAMQQISRAKVAFHNKPNDCWVVIDQVVYDLSNFKDVHPGGKEMILRFAGKDATSAFREYGHTPFATA